MERLLAVGEGGHQETDAEDQAAEDRREVAADAARQRDPLAAQAHHLDPHGHLAGRGHRVRRVEPGVVAGADDEREQVRDHLDQQEAAVAAGAADRHQATDHAPHEAADDHAGHADDQAVDDVGRQPLQKAGVDDVAAVDDGV
ncbi:hypothetical protein BLX88_04630, partial [Bacillus obstructivus]